MMDDDGWDGGRVGEETRCACNNQEERNNKLGVCPFFFGGDA